MSSQSPPRTRRRARARRTVLLTCLFVLGTATGSPAAAAPPPDRGDIARVLVLLRADADPDAEARSASGNGARVTHVYRNALRGFAAGVPEQALEGLRRNPRVEAVEPDAQATASPTQTSAPWGLDRIDQRSLPLSGTFSYPNSGAGVSAYVLDTGILAGHTDFGTRLRAGYTAIADGRGTSDCNGHGTHVAGTVAGTTYGVAKAVLPVAVRVLGCDGAGAMSGVVAGLDWAAGDHAAGAPAVANLSLGGPATATLDAAVQGLIDDGVTVALAAGNSNLDACTTSPARTPAALTVGATDRTDTRASFSNFGTCLDLFAPGVAIASDWFTGPTATATLSGTSMAAPHVAGAAALLLGAQAALTPAQVAAQLVASAGPGVVGAGAGSPNRLLFAAPASACSGGGQRLANPGFESGTTGWTAAAGVIGQFGTRAPARTGTWSALLGGKGVTNTRTLAQSVTIPAGCTSYTLSFWLRVTTAEATTASANDRLTVTLGSAVTPVLSNRDRNTAYVQKRFDVAAFAGRTVPLTFSVTENGSRQTSFVVDDTAVSVG